MDALRQEVAGFRSSHATAQQERLQLQEELQAVRLEGRRKVAELEANILSDADVQKVQLMPNLSRLENKLRAERQQAEDSM